MYHNGSRRRVYDLGDNGVNHSTHVLHSMYDNHYHDGDSLGKLRVCGKLYLAQARVHVMTRSGVRVHVEASGCERFV